MTDGMAVATQIAAQLDVFDYDVVEILRGPQGIFFGRNSIGGAVHFRTGKPSEEFGGRVEISGGSHGLFQLEGIVEGSIGDRVRAKLAVQHRQFDGYYEDDNGGIFVAAEFNPAGTEPGTPQQTQTLQDSIFIKPTITFDVSDAFDFTIFAQYFKDDGGAGSSTAFIDPRRDPRPTQTRFGYIPPTDQFGINYDLLGRSDTELFQFVGEANWELGNGVLTSVTGFRDLDFVSSIDVDGTPFTLIHFPDNKEHAEQFSQELRYAVDITDNFDLIVGAFYMDSEMSVEEKREFTGLTAGRDHFDYNYIRGDWTQDTTSMALFSNARFAVTDVLTLSAGFRYSQEEKDMSITTLSGCAGPGFTGCPNAKTDLSEDWSNFSPRFGVEYRPEDNVMYSQVGLMASAAATSMVAGLALQR